MIRNIGATDVSLPDLSINWDIAVIGSGIGGATVGWALASRGLSVLIIERGGAIAAVKGQADPVTPEARLAQGWWPNPVSQRRPDGRCERFFAPVGCALGGSSIHYAAALERMSSTDFEGLGAPFQRLPPWPVAFNEFSPFYDHAESLYGIVPVSGNAGELRISEWDRKLMQAMRIHGLKPDLLHVAMRYDDKCKECIGEVCPRGCKADARTACLEQALQQPGCTILDHCDVQSLDADADRVRTIHAKRHGHDIEVRARVVVLAAGALHSPQILLRSRNRAWPNGLANHSDQVGRNLMFHTADIYALWAPRRLSRNARQKKAISIRDFYIHGGQRLGYIQSMGLEAGQGEIAVYLKDQLRRRGVRNELLLRIMVKLPSIAAALILGGAGIFAAMTEDDPDPNNRLVLDPNEPDGASFSYTITDDLRRRADALREAFARHVRPWRLTRLSPELTMNYGHPCGTCRFGNDPSSNVLDRDCRAHGLDNLYVVDASFMPRSGAVNPSLTIAANALRVAPQIAMQLSRIAA